MWYLILILIRCAGVQDSVAALVQEGKNFAEIWAEHPGFALVHRGQIEQAVAFWALKRRLSEMPGIAPCQTSEAMPFQAFVVATWLNQNVVGRPDREFRTRQLYIHGATQLGKTTLVMELRKYLSVYDIPADEEYCDFYEDGMYDLAVLDEFEGQRSIQWMNRWLDGSPFTLRKKGAQVVKEKNIPTMILSNLAPAEAYPTKSPTLVNTFAGRLVVVELTEFLNVPINPAV